MVNRLFYTLITVCLTAVVLAVIITLNGLILTI
jgi:hypothetical protein